jgi:hypothetical protein
MSEPIKFKFDISFMPDQENAPDLWRAIADLIVAAVGVEEAQKMMAEAEGQLSASATKARFVVVRSVHAKGGGGVMHD